MRVEVLIAGENLLCTCLGFQTLKTIHVNSHHLLDIQNGSNQVHFEKPALTGRVARWQMILTKYDIQYTTQKAIKGSVLADHLSHQPLNDYEPTKFDFLEEEIVYIWDCNIPDPDEGPEPGSRWMLIFDGVSNAMGNDIRDIITSPEGYHIPFTTLICFDCTNNMAEYEACIYGIEAAIDLSIKFLKVYEDSNLVISQINGD